MYCFDEYLFNKESRKLWKKFERKKHGLRLTYIFLSVISKDKTNCSYGKWFRTSAREVSYRSGLCISQIKIHINSLILIKLVERKIKRTKKQEDGIDYNSESFYMVKPLNDENFIKAIDSFDYIDIAKYVKQNDKKVRSK